MELGQINHGKVDRRENGEMVGRWVMEEGRRREGERRGEWERRRERGEGSPSLRVSTIEESMKYGLR